MPVLRDRKSTEPSGKIEARPAGRLSPQESEILLIFETGLAKWLKQ
jgi:hypothetical protein